MGAVLALLLCASPRAGADIPSGQQTRTQKDYLKDKLGWLERTSVAAFEKSGKKDASWNTAARQFIDGACRFATFQDDAPDLAKLEQQVKDLSAAGCDDPVVLRWCGEVLMEKKDYAGAEETLRKALAGLEKSSYPKTNAYFASLKLTEALAKRPGTQPETDRLTSTTLEALVGAVSAGELEAKEMPLAYRQLMDLLGRSGIDDVSRWAAACTALKKAAGTDPWLLKMVEGELEITRAWHARGHGWANEVTAEGGRAFAEHVAKARDLMTEAWKMHPEYPEAAGQMISETSWGGGNAADVTATWFERAAQAQIDYLDAYQGELYALRPRWNGSHQAMENFGLQCLNTKRFDTDVPLFYLKALRDIGSELSGEGWRALFRRPGVADRLKRMFESMLQEKSQARDRDWLLAQQAVVASWCGQYDDAALLLRKLPPKVDMARMRHWAYSFDSWNSSDFPLALAEVRAFTGPQKETLLKAEELALANNTEEAVTLFKQAMEASKDDKEVYAYLRERIAFSRMGGSGGMWQGRTALHTAAEKGFPEMVTALLAMGADPDAKDLHGGGTPLYYAAKLKDTAVAALLLEKKANPNIPDDHFWTPLYHAAYYMNLPMAQLLVAHGADATLKSDGDYTALGLAIAGRNPDLAKMLISSGAAINQPCAGDNTPLASATRYGQIDVAALLIEKGADVNASAGQAWTALTQAAYYGRMDLARLLVEKGADVNAASKTRRAPLQVAVERGNTEIVGFLLEKGANVNAMSDDKWSPLLTATRAGANVETIRLLLEKGADVKARNQWNWTPLLLAAYYDDAATVRLLLEKGSDPNAALDDGRTALSMAQKRDLPEMVQLLSQDADPIGIAKPPAANGKR